MPGESDVAFYHRAAAMIVEAREHLVGETLDPRLVLAEAVAHCAMHFILLEVPYRALNAMLIAGDTSRRFEFLRELAQLEIDQAGCSEAMAAWELLDAAIRVWSPLSHPVGIATTGLGVVPPAAASEP